MSGRNYSRAPTQNIYDAIKWMIHATLVPSVDAGKQKQATDIRDNLIMLYKKKNTNVMAAVQQYYNEVQDGQHAIKGKTIDNILDLMDSFFPEGENASGNTSFTSRAGENSRATKSEGSSRSNLNSKIDEIERKMEALTQFYPTFLGQLDSIVDILKVSLHNPNNTSSKSKLNHLMNSIKSPNVPPPPPPPNSSAAGEPSASAPIGRRRR